MIEQEQDARWRQRLAASIISILLLLLLLAGWCAVRSTGEDGDLSSVVTGKVDVAVNPTDGGKPGTGSGFNRRPPLLTEVLGTGDEAPAPEPTATVPAASTATPVPLFTPTFTPVAPPDDATGGSTGPILTFDGLIVPGSYATGGVRVSNTGSSAFNFSVRLVTEGDAVFGAALKLRIYTQSGAGCSYPGQPPSGDNLKPVPGTVLYEGNFATGNKVGDPAVESAPGDLVLAPGASSSLCMELFFPWGAGNEFQDLTVTGTFEFTAKTPE